MTIKRSNTGYTLAKLKPVQAYGIMMYYDSLCFCSSPSLRPWSWTVVFAFDALGIGIFGL